MCAVCASSSVKTSTDSVFLLKNLLMSKASKLSTNRRIARLPKFIAICILAAASIQWNHALSQQTDNVSETVGELLRLIQNESDATTATTIKTTESDSAIAEQATQSDSIVQELEVEALSETQNLPVVVESTDTLNISQTDLDFTSDSESTVVNELPQETETLIEIVPSVENVLDAPTPQSETVITPVAFPSERTIEQVKQLVRRDSYNLAYRAVVESRQNYEFTPAWYDWEKLFFEIAFELQLWNEIVARISEIEDDVSQEFHLEIQTFGVKAELNLGQYQETRQRLRNLIWELPYKRDRIIEWRDLIAQTYIAENKYEDARVALTTFFNDYRPSDPQWESRYNRVLLRTGRAQEAAERLAVLQTVEGELLALSSKLLLKTLTPSQVVSTGLAMLPEFTESKALTIELWAVIEAAADALNDIEMQVIATESALGLNQSQVSDWTSLSVTPFKSEYELLDLYDKFAIELGNDFHLIIGDDSSWYQLAEEFEITAPVAARAIYVFLANNSDNLEMQRQAISKYADELSEANMQELLERLFLTRPIFDLTQVRRGLQIALANITIKNRDYSKALSIIDGLSLPEDESKHISWFLRNAKIAIAAGNVDKSQKWLMTVMDSLPLNSDQETLDRIIQVIFDLQTIGQHELAVAMFSNLYPHVAVEQMRREILRWVAESYSALDQHKKAAEFLFLSAGSGSSWNDEWGKSARLSAGDELAAAELYPDARSIFEQLENDTLDPRRRVVVTNRINRLPKTE